MENGKKNGFATMYCTPGNLEGRKEGGLTGDEARVSKASTQFLYSVLFSLSIILCLPIIASFMKFVCTTINMRTTNKSKTVHYFGYHLWRLHYMQ